MCVYMTEMPHAANPPETGARDGAILVRLCLLLGEGGGMIASSMALLLPTLPSILASPAATAAGCGDFLLISSCAARRHCDGPRILRPDVEVQPRK